MTLQFSASEDYGSARRTMESTKTIKAGKWSHIALSADQNRLRGYIDGRLVVESTVPIPSIGIKNSSNVTTGPMSDPSLLDRVWLGRQGGGGWFFDGEIDNVRIYRGALMGE